MGCGETPPDTHQPFCMQRRRRHSNTIPRAQLHFLSNFVKKSTGLCQVFDTCKPTETRYTKSILHVDCAGWGA